MDKAYDHKNVEEKLYKEWEEKGYFKPEINPSGKPFSIVLPPPNVTGTLHMGHALMLVIEDIIVRYHRMRGDKTLWLPGTDHAAIATHAKVEAILWKEEEKTRYDLGREKFVEKVEAFAKNSHDTIAHQMRSMGASVDWSREAYTLDDERNLAVRTAFKTMYDDGLIYKGARIVNWDPKMQTTVSDEEVEWREEKSPLYYIQYGPFVIATARPETKFGDKYVVMHPDDKRFAQYKDGQKIEVDWLNGKVTATVIKDEIIDMEFGTGAMTITPWHDKTDFDIATRHNLEKQQVIDWRGLLLPIAGELSGQHIKKARPLIVEKLKAMGLLVKIDENYMHRIATNSRGGGQIEPQIKEQWFVAVDKEFVLKQSELEGMQAGERVTLKKLMKHVIASRQITITPDHFTKTYNHWVDNLHDWCISRQIWFGHRVPVWYKGDEIYCGIDGPTGDGWEQDPDTLDTWFSSGLWTFSTMGWPKETEDLKTFHPTDVLETGYDILFFWVVRMILMTTYLRGQIPFKKVLMHGLVRDANKQKMSKSKGNIIDPLELSDKYGTDALRIGLIFSTAAGNDIPLSEEKIKGMKFFSNKLWNMARFIEMKKPEEYTSSEQSESRSSRQVEDAPRGTRTISELLKFATHDNDKAMIAKTQALIKSVSDNIDSFRLHDGAQDLYQFAWHEFADIYIEDVKNRIDPNSYYILNTLYDILLRLLHPFMPFITEEIYQKRGGEKSLMITPWPSK